MSDGRRGRSRHAAMVDGDDMGSKGMGGKVVMVDNALLSERCTRLANENRDTYLHIFIFKKRGPRARFAIDSSTIGRYPGRCSV
eukprot:scaffold1372_cov79-Skeletonema_marinoi.AAC.7